MSLRKTTFVVVDLETTGGRMTAGDGTVADAITEIGAVKVRGGVVLGEFATLIDPQRSIPPQIVQLTGITTAMVCDAPTIGAVLPMFFASPAAQCWWPITPGSTSGFCGPPQTVRYRMAATAGAVHRCAGPPGAQPRGSPQRAAGSAGTAVRGRQRAHPPGTRRRAGHRRCVARAHRTSGQSRGAHLRRPALVSA